MVLPLQHVIPDAMLTTAFTSIAMKAAHTKLQHAQLLFNNCDYHDALEHIDIVCRLNPNHGYAYLFHEKIHAVVHAVKKWRATQAHKARKELLANADERDEFQSLEDSIRMGGVTAETAVTVELSSLMAHSVEVFDSVVEGAPRRVKVDLAERAEVSHERLQNVEEWTIGDRTITDLLGAVSVCKEVRQVEVGKATHDADTPKIELLISITEQWLQRRAVVEKDEPEAELVVGDTETIELKWAALQKSETPVVGLKYRVSSAIDVRASPASDALTVGTLVEGDTIIVTEHQVKVVTGIATIYGRVLMGTLVPTELNGWIEFDYTSLDRYVPVPSLVGQLSDTPGYPNLQFGLLWNTLVKIGFPMNAIQPRSKAIHMLGLVASR